MEDLAEVRRRLRENPNDAWALRSAAEYYLKENYFRQAQNVYAQAVQVNCRLLPEILLDYEKVIEQDFEKPGPRFSLAGLLLTVGETDLALMELEELLDLSPQCVEAYNALGRIFIKQERIDEAIALLERSISEGIKDVNLIEILAGAYLEKGQLAEAIKFYEEILVQRPGDKRILRVLGELYTRVENFNKAALCYREMFSEDPQVRSEVIQKLEGLLKKVEGSIEIREILAEIYMKTFNPQEAVQKLKEILALEPMKNEEVIQRLRLILRSYPNFPPAVLTLAEALRSQGNFSEAVENYAQLVRIKPELVDQAILGYRKILESCPNQILARNYLAEVLLAQNQIHEALFEFEKMLKIDPSVADTVIKKCREILRSQPKSSEAHVVLGRAYLVKGDFQRAALEAEGVIALDKNMVSAYLLLGEAYAKLNLDRKSLEALRTALTLDPYNQYIHEEFRKAKEKETEEEIKSLKQRLLEDQWKISLHLELGKLYLQKGNWDEAIREFQLAQKDPARAALAHNLMGNLYRMLGRYDLAASQYNHALELAQGDLVRIVKFNLGTIYEAQGQLKKALRVYEGILQEDIDFGTSPSGRKELEEKIKRLKTTRLSCVRNRALQMVVFEYEQKEVIAFWGREARAPARSGRKEEISVSFGQNHNSEGFELFIGGMYQAAEEEFSLAVQLDPNFLVAINNLGVVLAKQGKLEEARLKFIEASEGDPASVVFFNNLGVVNFLLGKISLAKVALEKSFALDSGSSAVCLNLGDLYYSAGEIAKAIEFYQKVGKFDLLSDLSERRLLYKIPQS